MGLLYGRAGRLTGLFGGFRCRYTADSACNFWITASEAAGNEAVPSGAFRYAPSYQAKRVDLREGAYAWYKLDGGVANSAAAPGAYPYPHVPTFPRTPATSVAGSLDGAMHGALSHGLLSH